MQAQRVNSEPTDEERIARRFEDPDVQESIRKIKDRIAAGDSGPGIKPEELQDFLRDGR